MASDPTFVGLVTVHGLDGSVAYTGLAAGDGCLRRLSMTDTIEQKRTKDSKGETKGVKLFDPAPEIEVTFLPCKAAGGSAIANAKANTVLPAKGSKVTLANFPPVLATAEDTINSVKWIYLGGGRIEGSNEDDMQITLPLVKFNTDIAATANS